MTGAGVLRSEDTVCLSDIGTVRIRYCGLICHIVHEDSVADIRIHISHIQREWSTPGESDSVDVIFCTQSLDSIYAA